MRCFSSPKTPRWRNVQNLISLGTRSQHPVSLGSLWQPILKRCMQRMDRGMSRSDLVWPPAGLANRFLYVLGRESSVGQVPVQMPRLSQTASMLSDIPVLA